jgi:hypothetical protein
MSEPRSPYLEKLRDPRWQKRRLEILQRDGWRCDCCGDAEHTLNVHHEYYERGREPWDYPDDALRALCETCHASETAVQRERAVAERGLLRSLREAAFSREQIESLSDSLINVTDPQQVVSMLNLVALVADEARIDVIIQFLEQQFRQDDHRSDVP